MRSILVHADHDKANEVRLQTALDIARRLRAHLTLLIATPFRQFVAVDPFGGSYVLAEAMAKAQADDAALEAALSARLGGEGQAQLDAGRNGVLVRTFTRAKAPDQAPLRAHLGHPGHMGVGPGAAIPALHVDPLALGGFVAALGQCGCLARQVGSLLQLDQVGARQRRVEGAGGLHREGVPRPDRVSGQRDCCDDSPRAKPDIHAVLSTTPTSG